MEIGFWLFMLITELLVPAVMIGFGKSFMQNAPKEINPVFGYRTSMSMKNRDTWEFAHQCIGKLWYQWGLVLLPISIAVMLFFIGRDVGTVGTAGAVLSGLQILPMILTIIPTESALRKNFDEYGNKR